MLMRWRAFGRRATKRRRVGGGSASPPTLERGVGGSDVARGERVSNCRLFFPSQAAGSAMGILQHPWKPSFGLSAADWLTGHWRRVPTLAGAADMCSIREPCRSLRLRSKQSHVSGGLRVRPASHCNAACAPCGQQSRVGARRCRLLASPRARPVRAHPLLPRAVRLA